MIRGAGWCALVGLWACGSSAWPSADNDTVLVRIEVDDPDATQVSYRVWDERHELVRDELLPAADFPRIVRLFPADDDSTGAAYRGGLIEVETWTETLCPRARASLGFRYGVTTTRNTLSLSAPTDDVDCTPLFVAESAIGTSCTQEAPCGEVRQALDAAEGASRRFVIHVAGGMYAAWSNDGRFQGSPSRLPNVVRAWPGRSLPMMPTITSEEGFSCDPDDERACNQNSVCIDSFCADSSPISLCCQFDRTAPAQFEVDGLRTIGGKNGIEVNGAADITLRHLHVVDAGGPALQVPASGIRVFVSPRALVEHNHVERVADPTDQSPLDAVGILVDGIRGDESVPAATLRWNRVTGAEGGGLHVSQPDGPVVLEGNTWCQNGAGVRLERGLNNLNARHELMVNNRGADLSRGSFGGDVLFARSTFASDPSLDDGESRVEQSVLFGEGPAGTNLVNPATGPDLDGCLAGESLSQGVCDAFPFCEESE